MKALFELESPLMSFLSRLADLMILNLLTLVCCVPFITIGASFTAMYSSLLRLHNDKIHSVTKDFFAAFRENFRQATAIWIIYLAEIVVLAVDYYLIFISGVQILIRMKYVVYLFTALFLIELPWSFALLSRYQNSIVRTILNSCFVGFAYLPYTFLMLLPMLAVLALLLFFPSAAPVITLAGLSSAGYLQMILFSRVFEKLEWHQIASTTTI